MRPIGFFAALALLYSCTPTPHDVQVADTPLVLYPDYQNVTVPCNLAPLNCLVRNEGTDAVQLSVGEYTLQSRGNKVQWKEEDWRQLIHDHRGETVSVTLTARIHDRWMQFAPFSWTISRDSIDSYITYRLIEPGYEVWHEVEIEERCLENFSTKTLADGRQLGNRCMNCHIHGGNQGQYSLFYIRGEKGGAFVQREGTLRKVALSSPRANGGSVYGDWHPSGQYGVFSTNKIIPAFHSNPAQRLEVYDTHSDLMIVDFDHDSILTNPQISQSADRLETFPCFSADGSLIYFCGAENPLGDSIPNAAGLQGHIEHLKYNLYQVPFDATTGKAGTPLMIYEGEGSVSFPRCSPDGRWLAYTRSDYGTFPIWHREARIVVGRVNDDLTSSALPAFSPLCETDIHATYHTWSHNSHWLAFASKSYDTQYSRIHFVHIDEDAEGKITLSKALTLPQEDPAADDMNLRSFNIPDLSTMTMPFAHKEVKSLFEHGETTVFR